MRNRRNRECKCTRLKDESTLLDRRFERLITSSVGDASSDMKFQSDERESIKREFPRDASSPSGYIKIRLAMKRRPAKKGRLLRRGSSWSKSGANLSSFVHSWALH